MLSIIRSKHSVNRSENFSTEVLNFSCYNNPFFCQCSKLINLLQLKRTKRGHFLVQHLFWVCLSPCDTTLPPLRTLTRDPALLLIARSRSLPHAAAPSSSPCALAPSSHPTRDDRDRIHRPFLPMTTTLSGSRSSSLVAASLRDEHPPLRRRLLPSQWTWPAAATTTSPPVALPQRLSSPSTLFHGTDQLSPPHRSPPNPSSRLMFCMILYDSRVLFCSLIAPFLLVPYTGFAATRSRPAESSYGRRPSGWGWRASSCHIG